MEPIRLSFVAHKKSSICFTSSVNILNQTIFLLFPRKARKSFLVRNEIKWNFWILRRFSEKEKQPEKHFVMGIVRRVSRKENFGKFKNLLTKRFFGKSYFRCDDRTLIFQLCDWKFIISKSLKVSKPMFHGTEWSYLQVCFVIVLVIIELFSELSMSWKTKFSIRSSTWKKRLRIADFLLELSTHLT